MNYIESLWNHIKFLQSQLKLGGWHSIDEYYDWVRAQVGEIIYHETYWGLIIEELKTLGVEWDGKSVPESNTFYTDEATMIKIIPFLCYPGSYADGTLSIDCDDFSKWASSDASKIFKITSVMEIKGQSPYGYHSWSMCMVGDSISLPKFKFFEPDKDLAASGKLFDMGEYGYKPEKWK